MQNAKKYFFIAILAAFSCNQLWAQDDLLAQLESEQEETTTPVLATFKGSRIVNLQSPEMSGKGVLKYMFIHRFGAFNQDFWHNFMGLFNAQVRLSLDYSPTDWLNVGLGASGVQKFYDGFAKYRLARQTTGASTFPVSITGFSSMYYTAERFNDELPRNESDRVSYVHELIIARKFNPEFSLEIVPTLIHYNVVENLGDNNDVIALGIGGRYKVSPQHAISIEYVHQFNPLTYNVPGTDNFEEYSNSLSVGYVIETGGHIFQLFITNASGVSEPLTLGKTTGKWSNGDLHFGFNISRVFTIKSNLKNNVEK